MSGRSVEVTGRSVEEAITEGARLLGAPRDQVEVDVLDPGGRGLLGLGARQARVRVTVRSDAAGAARAARGFLLDVLHAMGVVAEVSSRVEEDGTVRLDVRGEGLGALIGRRGQTLDALQYLVRLAVQRSTGGERYTVVLDIEGYRARKEEQLRELALRAAARVRQTGRKWTLNPMSPADRRVVHLTLHAAEGIETRSEGRDPFRRVVILPKK